MAQMDYSPIVLRFIRSENEGADAGAKDHLLKIKRNENDYFWSYSEVNREKVQYMEFADGEAVLNALERMFHLLSWDEDPYEFIQVVAPGYPMVLLSAKHINKSWATLRPFLEGVFENWPLNTTSEIVNREDDDLANPEIDARDEESETESETESEAEEGEVRCGDGCDCKDQEEESDDESEKTDPEMPALVAQETPLQELLRLMRQLDQGRRVNEIWENAATNDVRQSNWVADAEERQRRDPITVRRVVNTPEGPRTHLRFV